MPTSPTYTGSLVSGQRLPSVTGRCLSTRWVSHRYRRSSPEWAMYSSVRQTAFSTDTRSWGEAGTSTTLHRVDTHAKWQHLTQSLVGVESTRSFFILGGPASLPDSESAAALDLRRVRAAEAGSAAGFGGELAGFLRPVRPRARLPIPFLGLAFPRGVRPAEGTGSDDADMLGGCASKDRAQTAKSGWVDPKASRGSVGGARWRRPPPALKCRKVIPVQHGRFEGNTPSQTILGPKMSIPKCDAGPGKADGLRIRNGEGVGERATRRRRDAS